MPDQPLDRGTGRVVLKNIENPRQGRMNYSPFSFLYTTSWYTVTVRLKNIRNTFAKRHPHFIFHAVFLHAAKVAGLSLEKALKEFCFHPRSSPLPRRMNKGREFVLELVFPCATRQEVDDFLAGLAQHLADPANNFSLTGCEPVRKRTLTDLENEFMAAHGLPEDEICLNFITPFSFPPKRKNRQWLIRKHDFLRALANRIANVTGEHCADHLPLEQQEIRLLPYYWEVVTLGDKKSSSNTGSRLIKGTLGRLYLRGDIQALLPPLLFCSELHLASVTGNGQKTRLGLGCYTLAPSEPWFDRQLEDFSRFEDFFRLLEKKEELMNELASTWLDQPAALADLHREMADGTYVPGAAQGFHIDKRSGGRRLIATLAGRDYLVHKYLADLLAGPMEKMFEDASVGFRRNRSRETARQMIREACNDGCRYVLESDVESFFDRIDWDIMLGKLADHLPRADRRTLALLEKILKGPLVVAGRTVPRTAGVITGSPLSPLLSNLYLDAFDEKMEQLGFRLVRYGDDFLVLTRTREEAEQALLAIEEILAKVKLTIKDEKTGTNAVDLGFSFLGLAFDADMDEDFVDSVSLARPLYIRNQFCYVGLDGNSIIIRRQGDLIARLPIHRVSEIVVLGNNVLSTWLLQRCVRERIPVSICSPMGWYNATLQPKSRKHYLLSRQHADRFDELSQTEQAEIAARLVMAKIHNYSHWLRARWPAEARGPLTRMETALSRLAKCDQVGRVRGLEGDAARAVFGFVNSLCKERFFRSDRREPRQRHDPYNSLLDFGYSLLFTRINVLLRGRGLNPYLGFLHSSKDTYESLVCDLQEPFRARIDRFIVKTLNRSIIREEHFECRDSGQFWLTGAGVALFIEAFEREMEVRLSGDAGTLGQLLSAQVRAVLDWAAGEGPLHFYRAGSSRSTPSSIRSIIPDMAGS